VYELAPLLTIAVLVVLLGGVVAACSAVGGMFYAVRWLSRRRWRFDTLVRRWDNQLGEEYSYGIIYAHPDDDEPGPDGEPPLP
jgi:hypothetical protein